MRNRLYMELSDSNTLTCTRIARERDFMLTLMREKATSWLVKILLGIIVLVFVFLGVGSYNSQKQNRVAVVNGESITIEAYKSTYQNLVARLRQQFGGQVSQELLDAFQIREQALRQLVNKTLILQEARKKGLQVTDEELSDAIASIPVFQKEGVFDPETYQSLLRANGLNAPTFEASQRTEMLAAKLQDIVTGSVRVSESEAREWYAFTNRKANMDVAVFRPVDFTPETPGKEEMAAYFDAHKETYRTEPLVRVAFLRFDPDAGRASVTVSDADVVAYYEEHTDQFFEPEKVDASHLLIKVEADADEALVEEKKAALIAIREQIVGGEDFAEMAKKHSEGPSSVNGGQLGAFTRETMVKPFADAAFTLNEGEMSEPVRTRFGWHLILVNQKIPSATRALETVKEEIRSTLVEDKARTRAYDLADAVYDATLEGADLNEAAKTRDLTVEETGFFDKKGPATGIAVPAQFAASAFSLEPGETSELIEVGNSLYLMEVLEKKDSEIPAIEEVEDQVRADLLAERAETLAKDAATAFLAAAADGAALAEISSPSKVTVKTTGAFGRNGAIPEMGNAPALNRAVFALTGDKMVPEAPVKIAEGYAVFKVLSFTLPDAEAFASDKEDTIASLTSRKKNQLSSQWLTALREAGEVLVEPAFQN